MKNNWVAYASFLSLSFVACSTSEPPLSMPPSLSPSPVNSPSPTLTPSPIISALPSENPSPEPSALSTPVSADPQLHYLSEGHLATRLFAIESETGNVLAWQTEQGETKLFDGDTTRTLVPSIKYNVINPMLGYINAEQKGLLFIRAETSPDNPDHENQGNSQSFTLQNNRTFGLKTFAKRQIRALGLTAEGNGYALLSNEYRPPINRENTELPHVAVYTAKVTDFTVGEPELLFETEISNVSGKAVVFHASIAPDGSGFVLLPSFTPSGTVLQKFNQQQDHFDPQFISSTSDSDYFLSNPARKTPHFLTKVEVEVKDRYTKISKLAIYGLANNQLTGQVYRLPAPVIWGSSLRQKHSLIPYDLKLDILGNGLLVSVDKSDESRKDIILLQRFKNFTLQDLQRFVYPGETAVIDLKLMVDDKGTGKLIILEEACVQDNRCSNFFPENGDMQLSYLHLQGFSLK
jgi:hypothetical protein